MSFASILLMTVGLLGLSQSTAVASITQGAPRSDDLEVTVGICPFSRSSHRPLWSSGMLCGLADGTNHRKAVTLVSWSPVACCRVRGSLCSLEHRLC